MGLASPLVYVIAPLLLAAQTVSQTAAPGDAEREEMLRLRECLELVETDPEAAHEMAASWTYMEGNRRGALSVPRWRRMAGNWHAGQCRSDLLKHHPPAARIF